MEGEKERDIERENERKKGRNKEIKWMRQRERETGARARVLHVEILQAWSRGVLKVSDFSEVLEDLRLNGLKTLDVFIRLHIERTQARR